MNHPTAAVLPDPDERPTPPLPRPRAPIMLGRRMAISPLMLILALMLFGWLWGMIGLLLAVPMLVCIKLVLGRLDGMQRWARLLE